MKFVHPCLCTQRSAICFPPGIANTPSPPRGISQWTQPTCSATQAICLARQGMTVFVCVHVCMHTFCVFTPLCLKKEVYVNLHSRWERSDVRDQNEMLSPPTNTPAILKKTTHTKDSVFLYFFNSVQASIWHLTSKTKPQIPILIPYLAMYENVLFSFSLQIMPNFSNSSLFNTTTVQWLCSYEYW